MAANLDFTHVDSGGTNVSRVGNEEDAYRNDTVNLKLGWSPVSALKIDLSGRLVDIDNQTDGDLGLGVPSDSPGITHTFQAYFGGRAVLSTFDGHWRHTLSGSVTRIANSDADTATQISGRTSGTKNKLGYQSTWRFATSLGIAAEHTFTAAVDYERTTFHQRGLVDPLFGDPNQNRVFTSAGYVGEYRLTLAEHTHLGASGRFDDNHQFASIWTYRVSAAQDLLRIQGTTMGRPEEFATMVEFINRHRIEPLVDQTFSLVDAATAFQRMYACEQMGKLVLLNTVH